MGPSQQHDRVWHSLTCFFSRGLQCARSVLVQSEGTQLLCHSHGRHLHISFHLQRSNPLPVHLHGLAYPLVRHRRRQLWGGGDQWVGRLGGVRNIGVPDRVDHCANMHHQLRSSTGCILCLPIPSSWSRLQLLHQCWPVCSMVFNFDHQRGNSH